MMDEKEVAQWLKYCSGDAGVDLDFLEGLFKEVFLNPLTPRDRELMSAVFSVFPGRSRDRLLGHLFSFDDRADDRQDDEILSLIRVDLSSMCKLINRSICGDVAFTKDERDFESRFYSQSNTSFISEIGDALRETIGLIDDRVFADRVLAISGAFYGLASDQRLKYALTAELLDWPGSFGTYIDLYRIGVNYAFLDTKVIAINYRSIFRDRTGVVPARPVI